MSEKRLDYDLLWNNYYQVIELDDGDTDYLRRLSPTEIIKRLNEQQATIQELEEEIKLLKPTNIEQYEQIQKLRKELGDCEKFRYQVFKRMNDEYIKECSIR